MMFSQFYQGEWARKLNNRQWRLCADHYVDLRYFLGWQTNLLLGGQDSNLGMRAPKARVLPLDDTPEP